MTAKNRCNVPRAAIAELHCVSVYYFVEFVLACVGEMFINEG